MVKIPLSNRQYGPNWVEILRYSPIFIDSVKFAVSRSICAKEFATGLFPSTYLNTRLRPRRELRWKRSRAVASSMTHG